MKGNTLHTIATICLSIFLFILVHAFYTGVTTSPVELDSVKYHIPIAKSYLDGRIFSSPDSTILHRFFPGASEGILAIFILLHIPLNLYNVLGAGVFCIVLYKLARHAGLQENGALIYASSFSSLTTIVRWLNVQIVDIWVAVVYAWLVYLLLKPQRKAHYFLLLGIAAGMLVGSKYSGPIYLVVLMLFSWRGLLRRINPLNLASFAVPFLVIGGFWYLRNFIVLGNPVYPLSFFGLPGVKNWALEIPVWRAAIAYPFSMMSALLSEYMVWAPLILIAPLYLVWRLRIKKMDKTSWYFALGLMSLIAYLPLPNGESYTVHVSNMRYSYPIFLVLVLGFFVWMQKRKLQVWTGVMAIAAMLFSLQVPHHPKLLVPYAILLYILWKSRGFVPLDER